MEEADKKYCPYCGVKLSELVNEDTKREHTENCGKTTEQKVIKG